MVPGPARCVQTFRGEPGKVKEARMFVGSILAGCPARETLLTCVSELAANAIEHTASGRGGAFTVEVGRLGSGRAFVAVTDDGAASAPEVRPAGALDEGGRGLALVAACSSRWGYRDGRRGRTVWAEVTWPVAVREPGTACGARADIWEGSCANVTGTDGIA
jgi:serine/threonine-protein kinase RsbW